MPMTAPEIVNSHSYAQDDARSEGLHNSPPFQEVGALSCNTQGYPSNDTNNAKILIPSFSLPLVPPLSPSSTSLTVKPIHPTSSSLSLLSSPQLNPNASFTYKNGRLAGLLRPHSTDKHQFLSRIQFRNLLNATRFAESQNTPLTAHVIIRWPYAPGFKPEHLNTYQTKLIGSLRSWLVHRKIPLVYTYVIERASKVGIHTHLLLHLPTDRWVPLRDELEAHLVKAGSFTNPLAVMVTPDNKKGAITEAARRGLFIYLSKGLDPTEMATNGNGLVPLVHLLGIISEPGLPLPPGIKRAGWSENIGLKTRQTVGWHELHELSEVSPNFISMGRRMKHVISKANQERRAEMLARGSRVALQEEEEAA